MKGKILLPQACGWKTAISARSWDAWNGTIKQLELPVQEMKLSLGQRESLILVTAGANKGWTKSRSSVQRKKNDSCSIAGPPAICRRDDMKQTDTVRREAARMELQRRDHKDPSLFCQKAWEGAGSSANPILQGEERKGSAVKHRADSR